MSIKAREPLISSRPQLATPYLWRALHPVIPLNYPALTHVFLRAENLIAFGDGNNDVEFIDFAGWGVSMKNGSTAAKAVADVVLPYTNDEHGVARTLEEYFEAGVFEQEQEEERGGGIMRQHASVKKGLN